jgi:hypothetical protein
MEEIKLGLPTRFNEKFLAQFVTNRSIDLDNDPLTAKIELKLGDDITGIFYLI